MEENKDLVVIEQSTSDIVKIANNYQVLDDESYQQATDVLKQIKTGINQIKNYWKVPKENASKAHKEICNKEKEMLQPLEMSDKLLRAKVSAYYMVKEEEKKQEEERLKKAQEELALQQLQEAENLRRQGDEIGATIIEQNAIAISELEVNSTTEVAKASGVSYVKDYDIIITDVTKVPSYLNGIELRSINLSAIKSLVKSSNNTIKIDGIEVREIKQARIRV